MMNSKNIITTMEIEEMKNIRKRTDGTYEARVQINGIRKSVYGATKIEIKQKLKKLKNNKQAFEKETIKNYRLYEWLEIWRDTYKVNKVKTRTLDGINYTIKQIKKYFKDTELNNLDALKIQQTLNDITTERTKEYIYQVFNEAIKKAEKLKLVKTNIFEAIDKPKRMKYKKRSALTTKQEKELISAIENSDIKNIILFYLYSGTRKTEALNLKWEDIDFDKKTIHIKGTKSKTSDRIIPIFKKLENLLMSIERTNEKVFDFSEVTLKRRLSEIKKNLSFEFTLHQLRHTFATRCVEAGVDMKVLQKWLGHSSIVVTAEIYVDVLNEYEIEQSKLIN